MIKLEHVTKKFVRNKDKNEKEEFYEDKDISFEANDGEIIRNTRPKWRWKNNSFKNGCRNTRNNRWKDFF